MKRTATQIAASLRLRFLPRPHEYRVTIDGMTEYAGDSRHAALQFYMAERKRLDDHESDDPSNFRVRIFCDGREFFNDVPKNWGDTRGLSTRSVYGGYAREERHMP